MKKIKIIDIKALGVHDKEAEYARLIKDERPEAKQRLATLRAQAYLGHTDVKAALDKVNGKATAHTYTTALEIHVIAVDVEKRLGKSGIPKAERAGVVVEAVSAVPTAKAYNRHGRTAVATRVRLVRGTSAWFLTDVSRVDRYTGPGGEERINVTITPQQRDAVVKHALREYRVEEPVKVSPEAIV